ncbi:MAG: cobalamin biosynthesis protein, partial [Clostridia bacterium]|nr:cobalamin biosynthesis protein [Clostridia bacterium]
MSIFTAVLIAFVLDIVLGDPEWMPHPVVLMGKVISKLSERFRNKKPPTPEGERRAGLYLAIVVPLLT